MTDRYQDFASSSLGKLLVKHLGLPHPVALDRYAAGSPLVDGTVVLGGNGRLEEHLPNLGGDLRVERAVFLAREVRREVGIVLERASILADVPRAMAARRNEQTKPGKKDEQALLHARRGSTGSRIGF